MLYSDSTETGVDRPDRAINHKTFNKALMLVSGMLPYNYTSKLSFEELFSIVNLSHYMSCFFFVKEPVEFRSHSVCCDAVFRFYRHECLPFNHTSVTFYISPRQ